MQGNESIISNNRSSFIKDNYVVNNFRNNKNWNHNTLISHNGSECENKGCLSSDKVWKKENDSHYYKECKVITTSPIESTEKEAVNNNLSINTDGQRLSNNSQDSAKSKKSNFSFGLNTPEYKDMSQEIDMNNISGISKISETLDDKAESLIIQNPVKPENKDNNNSSENLNKRFETNYEFFSPHQIGKEII